uniref:Uncharacterized protein n=1 Tax=Aureoumbra lagunensis TaxID=44058 RepID=A0A7S3K597_9STRA|mmetsp:Transcript_13943/g.20953  ORF Transcript_13943/g.20953 Transcript_13943/m.20953 type:complete len:395 (+) Transcript_13943:544-1728(+)
MLKKILALSYVIFVFAEYRCAKEGEICADCDGEVRYGVGSYSDRILRRVVNTNIRCSIESFTLKKKNYDSEHNANTIQKRDCLCQSAKRRIAICFWGVNRALNKTANSIYTYIIKPLEEEETIIDIFFHSYTLESVNSAWAKEHNTQLQGALDEYKQLSKIGRVKRWEATEQGLFDKEMNYFSKYKEKDSVYPRETLKNLLRSLNSLKRVTNLWLFEEEMRGGFILFDDANKNYSDNQIANTISFNTTRRNYYDKIIYIRPDLLFKSPLDVDFLFSIPSSELYTPIWATYHGLNDRLAAGAPLAVLAFGYRFNFLSQYLAKGHQIHSERFLAWSVYHSKIKPAFSNFPCGVRVRHLGAANKDCMRVESRFAKHPALKRQILSPPTNMATKEEKT